MTYPPFQASSGRSVNRINRLLKDMLHNSGMGRAHIDAWASPAVLFFYGRCFSFAKYMKNRYA
jgi:hypothetical protein